MIISVYLKSYQGVVGGAWHMYGTLCAPYGDPNRPENVDVVRPMTIHEVVAENNRSFMMGRGITCKPGEMTGRLRDEDDVAATALGMWKEHFPLADQDSALDHVLQFAHIAGPVVVLQQTYAVRRYAQDVLLELSVVALHELVDQ